MKTLYLDLFSGISGNMFLGAMLDLGLDLDKLQTGLRLLPVEGYSLEAARTTRSGFEGTLFEVHLEKHSAHHHHHSRSAERNPSENHSHGRNFADIQALISQSALSDWVKAKSLAVFGRIAKAEGKIHGRPPEAVHFHEVGAIDSIVDIVGACIALELIGKPRLLASRVVDGSGWIECAHGRLPVPAPATLEILAARGIAISQCDEPHELVTPTGAALLAELVESFGPMANLAPQRIGISFGTRENKTRPNLLRAVLGQSQEAGGEHDWESDSAVVLETNLDDISPEILGSFVEKALSNGALDVFYTPAQMKKNRPGVLLTVLCAPPDADRFCELIFRETTAFGVRRTVAERKKLRREFLTVPTNYGDVTVKLGKLDGKVVQAAPEHESCRKLAQEKNVPLKAVFEAAAAELLKVRDI